MKIKHNCTCSEETENGTCSVHKKTARKNTWYQEEDETSEESE